MTYIQRFINLLGLQRFDLTEILFKTVNDCESFYIDFLGNNKYIIDDLLDYREYKIKNSNITIDKFLEMCHTIGVRQSFETTFLQALSDEEISFIENSINNKKISLEEIYNDFQKNINKNILKIVL